MELDGLIREKRGQLKDAFAAYQKAREAAAQARATRADSTGLEKLDAEERSAAKRFHKTSEELAALHRQKFGEWRCTWRGPMPGPGL